MGEVTAKMDEKCRVMIPKNIRKAAKIRAGTYVNIKTSDTTIIIEAAESVVEKYGVILPISQWPEDLDEFVVEATKKWWTSHARLRVLASSISDNKNWSKRKLSLATKTSMLHKSKEPCRQTANDIQHVTVASVQVQIKHVLDSRFYTTLD